MKNKMPSEWLRLGRDSGSILCDTLKQWRFRTVWGGGNSILAFFTFRKVYTYKYRQVSNKGTLYQQHIFGNMPLLVAYVDKS